MHPVGSTVSLSSVSSPRRRVGPHGGGLARAAKATGRPSYAFTPPALSSAEQPLTSSLIASPVCLPLGQARAPSFGAAWSAVEHKSPLFHRRLLKPAELPDQISGARRAPARLRKGALAMREHVESEVVMPFRSMHSHSLTHCGDEQVCGLFAG